MDAFGGVSQAEHKKLEGELRKKKEEVYSLQIEVKELSEKISEMQREQNERMEDTKHDYVDKIKLLESKLADNTLL